MVTLSEARERIEAQKQQAEQAEQQLEQARAKLPNVTTQRALRQQLKGLQGRDVRRRVAATEEVIVGKEKEVEQYKEQVGKAEEDLESYSRTQQGKLQYAKEQGLKPVRFLSWRPATDWTPKQIPVYNTPYGEVVDFEMQQTILERIAKTEENLAAQKLGFANPKEMQESFNWTRALGGNVFVGSEGQQIATNQSGVANLSAEIGRLSAAGTLDPKNFPQFTFTTTETARQNLAGVMSQQLTQPNTAGLIIGGERFTVGAARPELTKSTIQFNPPAKIQKDFGNAPGLFQTPLPFVANIKAKFGKETPTIDLDSNVYSLTKQKSFTQRAALSLIPDTFGGAMVGTFTLGAGPIIGAVVPTGALLIGGAGYTGYETYKYITAPTIEEKAGAAAGVVLGGVGTALLGYSYLGPKIRGKVTVTSEENILKMTPSQQRAKGFIEESIGQSGRAGTGTTGKPFVVETKGLKGFGQPQPVPGNRQVVAVEGGLKNWWAGTDKRVVYSGSYVKDAAGYNKALKLLVKQGYTEKQARVLIRENRARYITTEFTGTANVLNVAEETPLVNIAGAKVIRKVKLSGNGYETLGGKAEVRAVISKGKLLDEIGIKDLYGADLKTLEIGKKGNAYRIDLTTDKSIIKGVGTDKLGGRNVEVYKVSTTSKKVGGRKTDTSLTDVTVFTGEPAFKVSVDEPMQNIFNIPKSSQQQTTKATQDIAKQLANILKTSPPKTITPPKLVPPTTQINLQPAVETLSVFPVVGAAEQFTQTRADVSLTEKQASETKQYTRADTSTVLRADLKVLNIPSSKGYSRDYLDSASKTNLKELTTLKSITSLSSASALKSIASLRTTTTTKPSPTKTKIKITVPLIPKPKVGVAKTKLISSAGAKQLIEVFARRRGKDIKIGETFSRGEAIQILGKKLKSTLAASGFATIGGEKIRLDLGGREFGTAKRDSLRVVQRRGYRLGTRSEVSEIMGYNKRKGRSKIAKWF